MSEFLVLLRIRGYPSLKPGVYRLRPFSITSRRIQGPRERVTIWDKIKQCDKWSNRIVQEYATRSLPHPIQKSADWRVLRMVG
ncbi:hypothetical protein NDU88_003085 [Pleurodeles waltl]|uniref:Uncharacterized protein n=1 Tax=Pleurodeles waltl TaxID=8319 RepID=A0AAV7NFP3_PLEWA|nr:hypothetical protein NDU88_003085 [Pleurodeles waltl]